MTGSTPPCRELTMETIDTNNRKRTETHHVIDYDIKNMDPCGFRNKRNPVSGKTCKEFFDVIDIEEDGKLPDDYIIKVYIAALGAICLYFVYKMNNKR